MPVNFFKTPYIKKHAYFKRVFYVWYYSNVRLEIQPVRNKVRENAKQYTNSRYTNQCKFK